MGRSPSYLIASRTPHCPEDHLAPSTEYCQIHKAFSKWAFRTDTAERGASQAQCYSTQEVLWCNIKPLHVRLSVLQIQNPRGFYFDKLLLNEQNRGRQSDTLQQHGKHNCIILLISFPVQGAQETSVVCREKFRKPQFVRGGEKGPTFFREVSHFPMTGFSQVFSHHHSWQK